MRFTKAKIVAAGMILAGICMIAPQQLRAEVLQEQMDGGMGQSIKEEMDDTQISDVDTQRDGLLSTYAMPRLLGASKASSGYTQDFLDGSFTSKVDYTSVTYYHKSDYEDAQLLNGIDVSWWQAKNKKTTAQSGETPELFLRSKSLQSDHSVFVCLQGLPPFVVHKNPWADEAYAT